MVHMKALTGIDVDSSGKDKETRENIIWWPGRTSANPRTRVALEL
jgi:hypothetical protein